MKYFYEVLFKIVCNKVKYTSLQPSSSPLEPLTGMPVLNSIPVMRPLAYGPVLLHKDLRLGVKAVVQDPSVAITEGPQRLVGHAAEEALVVVGVAGPDRVRALAELLCADAAAAPVLVVDESASVPLVQGRWRVVTSGVVVERSTTTRISFFLGVIRVDKVLVATSLYLHLAGFRMYPHASFVVSRFNKDVVLVVVPVSHAINGNVLIMHVFPDDFRVFLREIGQRILRDGLVKMHGMANELMFYPPELEGPDFHLAHSFA